MHLAEAEGPVPVQRIATAANVPAKYLAAILRDLAWAGVLNSSPGRGGGFCLARPANSIRLHEIFEPFEPMLWKRRPCPFGRTVCSDDDPCGGHEQWRKVRGAFLEFLYETTVANVSSSRNERPPKKTKRR